MAAWPLEDLWFRPVATLLLALAVPLATGRLTAIIVSPQAAPDARAVSVALWAARPLEIATFVLLGATAFAPALLSGPAALVVGGVVGGSTAALSAFLFSRRFAPSPVGGDVRRSAIVAGVLVGLIPIATATLVERLTRLDPDRIATTSPDTAWRRLHVDPRDGAAMLAAAWASSDANDPQRATARIDEAERMGAPAPELAEARAEVAASEGDCAAARAHFDRALVLRAEAAFAAGAMPELTLGGYHLPPSMITRCEEEEDE